MSAEAQTASGEGSVVAAAAAVSQPQQWYYVSSTKATEGPCTMDDMRDLFDEKVIDDETYVWCQGVTEWAPMKSLPQFMAKMQEPHPEPEEEEKEGGAGEEGEGGKGSKKRKNNRDGPRKRKKRQYTAPTEWFDLKKNTSVYVTGLPTDSNVDEIVEYFKKAGVIKFDPVTKLPKVKLYKNTVDGPDGQKVDVLKGDALVTYLKPESVMLAEKLLNETPLRAGGEPMSIQPAKFEQKGQDYSAKDMREVRKAARQQQKSHDKMFSWHDADEDENPRVIVIKHAFHPSEFAEEVNLKDILRQDMMQECGKLGTVEKMRIYEDHPDGVISIKFADSLVARHAIQALNGRKYAKRPLEVAIWDNKTDYRQHKTELPDEKRLLKLMRDESDSEDSDSDEKPDNKTAQVAREKKGSPETREAEREGSEEVVELKAE